MQEIMDRIDEVIGRYNNIITMEEPIIISKLRMVNDLYPECEGISEEIFFNEIIKNLADVIELQKEMIESLRTEAGVYGFHNKLTQGNIATNGYIPCFEQDDSNYETDEQVKNGFVYYLTNQASKPLSSYTINDYCSRIRNLWKSFYKAYTDNKLPKELQIDKNITEENSFLNAYNYVDELDCYIAMMSATSEEKRNWANISAAFNKFVKFVINK